LHLPADDLDVADFATEVGEQAHVGRCGPGRRLDLGRMT
jgi:hypothetical protein